MSCAGTAWGRVCLCPARQLHVALPAALLCRAQCCTACSCAAPRPPVVASAACLSLPPLPLCASTCSYFLQPKAAIMSHLEEAVKGSDGELKKLNSSRWGRGVVWLA